MLKQELKDLVKKYSLIDVPKESCGFIVKMHDEFAIVRCENIATEPTKFFVISPEETENVKKYSTIEYIWHSHSDGSFSDIDKYVAEKLKTKFLLYDIKNDSFNEYEPNGYEIPYLNRTFLLGVMDCIQLAIDYYERELNIKLEDDFSHPIRLLDNWDNSTHNSEQTIVFENSVLKAGFIEIKDIKNLKKHDIILTRLPGIKCSCHCAIYIGENKILHHVPGRLSCIEAYTGIWKRLTTGIFRHSLNV